MRICSLLPSATEIVCALGLGDQLGAVTHECDFPPEVSTLPPITRSAIDHSGSSSREIHHHINKAVHTGSCIYDLDQDLLKELQPDLILTQELCQVCAVSYGSVQEVVRLLEGKRKVLSLEPTSLSEILQTIEQVAKFTGMTEKALRIVAKLQQRIDLITALAASAQSRPRVFAMEWLNPPLVGGHWVPEMIESAGETDRLGSKGLPSFEVSWSQISQYDPQIAVWMPCGFDLARTQEETTQVELPQEWHSMKAATSGHIYAVDRSAYSNRPGPRIVDGLQILAEIIHPEFFPRQSLIHAWQPLE